MFKSKKISFTDFLELKLGGSKIIVQIDESMANHLIKAPYEELSSTRTDFLRIVKYQLLQNCCHAQIISDKSAATIILIIERNVCFRSNIV